MPMRRHLPLALCSAVLATVLGACPHGTDTASPTPTTAAVTRPKLVVLIVIDQLPSWSFDRDRDDLDGGIAGLLVRGALWPKARYPYATTNTAPGHATIGSGTTPSVHGIIANRWYVEGQRVGVDRDDAVAQFGVVDGARHPGGASAHRLRVPGIADALHAATPAGKAVAIAWKPRAAVLMLGQHPDLALWFDAEQGAMTTSTAYTDRLPAWVAPLAAAHPPSALLQPWHADDADALARMTGRGDDQDGEGDPAGLGARFPHDPSASPAPLEALGLLPAANGLLVDAAIAALEGEQLGRDDAPDLLAVSFSPHDYAGHAWCQESWERSAHLLDIDRGLARLVAALDAAVGREQYAVVLTSDHGALPSRAAAAAAGRPAPLLLTDTLVTLVERTIAAELGEGRWVDGATTTELTLSAAFHAQPAARRELAMTHALAALRDAGLAWVGAIDAMHEPCGETDRLDALACRSVFAPHSGDIYMIAPEHALLDDEVGECTAHGSPWSYDREVPILVAAPGRVAHGVHGAVPSMLQLAPTLADLLGVAPPAAARAASLLSGSIAPGSR